MGVVYLAERVRTSLFCYALEAFCYLGKDKMSLFQYVSCRTRAFDKKKYDVIDKKSQFTIRYYL